jgi:hypothetical protein
MALIGHHMPADQCPLSREADIDHSPPDREGTRPIIPPSLLARADEVIE